MTDTRESWADYFARVDGTAPPTRPLNPDALGPMYEALKDAIPIVENSGIRMAGRGRTELASLYEAVRQDMVAALALAEKGRDP